MKLLFILFLLSSGQVIAKPGIPPGVCDTQALYEKARLSIRDFAAQMNATEVSIQNKPAFQIPLDEIFPFSLSLGQSNVIVGYMRLGHLDSEKCAPINGIYMDGKVEPLP